MFTKNLKKDGKKMIKCSVCKKYLTESMFSRYEYTSICLNCRETEEGKKRMQKIDLAIRENFNKQQKYEMEIRNRKKNQIYDGQYDWM